jgi:protein phosphatase
MEGADQPAADGRAADSPLASTDADADALPDVAFRVAGASDVGTVREHNEDTLLVGDLDTGALLEPGQPWRGAGSRGPLLVVCDGMGGTHGGEVASDLAARVLWREMKGTPATSDPEVFARLLRRAVRVANHDVHAMSRREPALSEMGTTVCAAAVVGGRLIVATVGDSRTYVLRGDELVQVTRDQSLQSALLDAGHSEGEAASAGGAILQALGVGSDVEPSLSLIELRRGDRVLLCSDGLHGLVSDGALAMLLCHGASLEEGVHLLIEAARAAGGTDNITAIVLAVEGARFPVPRPDEPPRFREFDPQQEGDPALTSTSIVARRLAARIGLPGEPAPLAVPVTGQHAVLVSQIRRAPAVTAASLPGPAQRRAAAGGIAWGWFALIAVVAVACAWYLGGR